MHVAIISTNRARNVPRMEQLADGCHPTWYVGEGETGAYKYVGAQRVVESGGLCRSRNRALDDADGQVCLQLSDDLRKLAWAETKTETRPMKLAEAAGRMIEAMGMVSAQLSGVAPTPNPFFSSPRIHQAAFVVGDMIAVAAGCSLRFDEQFTLKEDYDYTLQHLTEHRRVARVDQLMATSLHGTNRGGAVDYRTAEEEDRNIDRLMSKWPGCFRPNPRRPHEVLLVWPPKSQVEVGA